MSEKKKVVIVGAGIAGLAAAFEILDLEKRGECPPLDLEILDGAPRAGGNIRTEIADGFVCEWGPEGFLDSVPETIRLAERVGLGARLVRARDEADKRFIYRDGRLRLVPLSPPAFLASDILPFLPRLRVFCEPLIGAKKTDADETVFDFASRRIGRGAATVLVDAMVSGVFAGDARRLSLKSAFPKMFDMERQYGGLVKAMLAKRREAKKTGEAMGGPSGPRGRLTSFDGGMEELIRALVKFIGEHRLRLGRKVETIRKTQTGFDISVEGGSTVAADALILAAPSNAAARILTDLSPRLAEALAQIEFASIAVLGCGYPRTRIRHPLDGFGFLIPRSENLRALGVLFSSSSFPNRAPNGHILLRTMIGGATNPGAISLSDSDLLELFNKEIAPILGIGSDPAWLRVFRFPAGIAQYNLGHSDRLARTRAELKSIPALFLSGSSYLGIAVNNTCEKAHLLARSVGASLSGGAPDDQIY